ncbi:MAG: hypothetical protein ACR2IJ_07015 [Fluviibacter sp.]
MGGFAAEVQQPQNQGSVQPQQSGKGGPVQQAVQQVGAAQNPNPDQGEPPNSGEPQQSPLAQYQQSGRPVGKGGAVTNSSTSGQPRIGMPNQYSNTVGQWDNTQQQTQQPMQGKGKGA